VSTAEPGRTPDPKTLLEIWMGWEKADTTPGMTLSQLKAKGLRDLLEALVASREAS
jgi:hypothetical protein